jgi:hypothetical protein
MRRSIATGLLLAAALVHMGCSSDNTSSTVPTPVVLTDTFDGSVSKNGATSHPFIATSSGLITALLVSEAPDSTLPIGMSLGTWNGSSCQVLLTKDNAVQGTALYANASGAGSLCLRMFDSAGTVSASTPVTYEVTVSHP